MNILKLYFNLFRNLIQKTSFFCSSLGSHLNPHCCSFSRNDATHSSFNWVRVLHSLGGLEKTKVTPLLLVYELMFVGKVIKKKNKKNSFLFVEKIEEKEEDLIVDFSIRVGLHYHRPYSSIPFLYRNESNLWPADSTHPPPLTSYQRFGTAPTQVDSIKLFVSGVGFVYSCLNWNSNPLGHYISTLRYAGIWYHWFLIRNFENFTWSCMFASDAPIWIKCMFPMVLNYIILFLLILVCLLLFKTWRWRFCAIFLHKTEIISIL